jgi:uncharacterized protein
MIKLRAHHLLCVPRFYRGGYDKKFAENMKKICMQIRKNPEIKIKVIVARPDDLCDQCPYWHTDRCVQSAKIGKWVVEQDKKVLKYLGLKENSIHRAKDIFNLSLEKVNPKTIKSVCKNCIFLENCIQVGVNKSFQKDINKK